MRYFILLWLFIGCIGMVTANEGVIQMRRANTIDVSPSGQYKTLEAGLKAVPSGTVQYTINMAAGTYTEQVTVSRSNLIIQASGSVTIQFNKAVNNSGISDEATSVFTIASGITNVKVYGIKFINTAPPGLGPALAVQNAGNMNSFYGCQFVGFQDTLLTNKKSTSYYSKCHIEGRVDFIWGYGDAYFQGCTIVSVGVGYLTAHNGDYCVMSPGGYVFNGCTLQAGVPESGATGANIFTKSSQTNDTNYLGRPWADTARVAYLNSVIGGHIKPAGWSEWSATTPNTDKVVYREYDNSGPGKWTSARASFAKQLSASEATSYSLSNFFSSIGTAWIDLTY